MKVKDAIAMLQKADPEDVLRAFDPNSEQHEEVTGMVYGQESGLVDLYTDEA